MSRCRVHAPSGGVTCVPKGVRGCRGRMAAEAVGEGRGGAPGSRPPVPVTASLLLATAVAIAAVLAAPVARWLLRGRGRVALADDLALLRWPVRVAAAALVARGAAQSTSSELARSAAGVALIVALAWVVLRVLRVVQQALFRRLAIDVADNLRARSRRTQIDLLRRVAAVVVVIGAIAVLLLTVTPLAEIAPTLVAYAGLIGVVLGIALRAPLESLAAGIIVAVTEPIRIDDVVVVEGEWGRVENIGLAQVVVRVWDDRRLVLPTARFVNEPFENWTKRSSAVTGTVTMWLDYTVDVDGIRAFVQDAARRSPLWDGRAVVVHVVELGERSVQIRVLVTASDAGTLWDLRCDLREQLLDHLQAHPGPLPVVRVDGVGRAAPRTPAEA